MRWYGRAQRAASHKEDFAMKQTAFGGKKTRQTKSISQPDSYAVQNAISIAPPDYGIDFVDSGPVAAMPLRRSSGSLIQAINMPESVAQRRPRKKIMRMSIP